MKADMIIQQHELKKDTIPATHPGWASFVLLIDFGVRMIRDGEPGDKWTLYRHFLDEKGKAVRALIACAGEGNTPSDRVALAADAETWAGRVADWVRAGLDRHVDKAAVRRLHRQMDKLASRAVVMLRISDELRGPSRTQVVLNDTEEEIVTALRCGALTGQELAKKLRRSYNSSFKAALATLRKREILGNRVPEGYFIESAYKSLLNKPDQGPDQGPD